MQTLITDMFEIQHPIIQGGMHYVGFAPLAAAVSNAGGLGIITALELKNTNVQFIRNHFSVVMERIVHELRGLSCLDINKKT